jgi:hypothetical protein
MKRERIKEAQARKNIYVDAHRIDCIYDIADKVFLRVKSHKSLIKFGKGYNLSPLFVGHFKVMQKKGPMAYRLALFSNSLRHMHDVFHASVL